MIAAHPATQAVFVGDGGNDFCAAVHLRQFVAGVMRVYFSHCIIRGDVVLARQGFPLQKAIESQYVAFVALFPWSSKASRPELVVAAVQYWSTHAHLAQLLDAVVHA